MKPQPLAFPLLALLLLLVGCDTVQEPASSSNALSIAEEALAKKGQAARGRIVIANRGSGTISVIDTQTDEVTTIPLPAGDNMPEPMYVVYTPARHRVFVGDRANDRVVAFDAGTLEVEGTVPAGGIFHMWADPQSKQLWVVDNVNDALTVIDPKRLEVITTIDVEGGTPHDVILDPKGRFAFATVFVDAGADQVVKYSTDSFMEVDRTDVGEDPHVSLNRQNNLLYVAAQGTDEVVVLDRETLDEVTSLSVPNAHGAGMAQNGKVFYTTNISDGGIDGLFAIDTRTNSVIGAVDTPLSGAPIATPHNIALTPDSKKLYITHSGAMSDQVSIYTLKGNNPLPITSSAVTVGLNPFGLDYIP
ncbi:MAG TPA: beta-propeller fold lactonase family protein [Rhodothermales bacterium]|nr:beta-propeller fold lactonase family protein [Rhodothermales bacterium]